MAAQTEPAIRLVLDGEQTIRGVESLRSRLLDALRDKATVEIDVDGATVIDVSVIQLMLAARNSARRSGGKIVLARPAGGALLDALTRGGFLAAASASADDAFWSKGATS